MNSALALAAGETMFGSCRHAETIRANLRGLDANEAFLAEKNNAPLTVEGSKLGFAIGHVDSELTGVAF